MRQRFYNTAEHWLRRFSPHFEFVTRCNCLWGHDAKQIRKTFCIFRFVFLLKEIKSGSFSPNLWLHNWVNHNRAMSRKFLWPGLAIGEFWFNYRTVWAALSLARPERSPLHLSWLTSEPCSGGTSIYAPTEQTGSEDRFKENSTG